MKLHLIINHAFIILFGIITNLSSAPVVCAKKEIAPRVMTIWWIFFNKPSECNFPRETRELECSYHDGVEMAETGQTYADLSILYGGGGITDKEGKLTLASTFYKSNCDLNVGQYGITAAQWFTPDSPESDIDVSPPQLGYCPSEGEGTELHIVIRDHGPIANSNEEEVLAQLTSHFPASCKSEGGSNLCLDVGNLALGPMTEDGTFTFPMENSVRYQPGCAARGKCTQVEEDLQLGGSGLTNLFTVTGDAIQTVIPIAIPDLPDGYFST